MADEEIDVIWKMKPDGSDVRQEISDLEKEGKKTANNIEKAFKAAFGAFASSKALGAIKDFFSSATESALNFEKQTLGLKSAADQAGISFGEVKNRVDELTRDGVLRINDVSSSLKILLAQGKNLDQSFQTVNAFKRIAALNNIVGDTSQAVADSIKGIATGSSDLLENADPQLRTLAKSVGGFAKVSNNAAVQQEFLNKVIERGNNLQKSYAEFTESASGAQAQLSAESEKLLASLGQVVVDSGAVQFLRDLVVSTREWLESLSPLQKRLLVISAGIVAVAGPTAVLIRSVISLTTALRGLSIASLAAAGPIGLIVAGIGALAAITAATIQTGISLRRQTIGLAEDFNDLRNNTNKTEKEMKQYNDTIDSLVNKYQLASSESEFFNRTLVDQQKALIRVNDLEAQRRAGIKNLATLKREELIELRNAIKSVSDAQGAVDQGRGGFGAAVVGGRGQNRRAAGSLEGFEGRLGINIDDQRRAQSRNAALANSGGVDPRLARVQALKNLNRVTVSEGEVLSEIERLLNRSTTQLSGSTKKLRQEVVKLSDFSKREFEKNIDSLNSEFDKFISTLNRARDNEAIRRQLGLSLDDIEKLRTEAIDRRAERERRLIDEELNSIEEFTGQEIEIRRRSIQIELAEAIDSAKSLASRKIIQEEELQARLEKIRSAARLKEVEADLEAANEVSNAVSSIVKATDVGGGISGIGQIAGVFNSQIGGIIGQAGSLITTIGGIFDGIFDNTEELRQQEEARQRQIEITTRLIEQEKRVQEDLVRLQSERRTLLSEDAQREIQLNNIQIANDEARAQANLNVLRNLVSSTASQAGISGTTPNELVASIGNLESSNIEDSAFLAGLRGFDFGDLIQIGDRNFNLRNIGILREFAESFSGQLTPQVEALRRRVLDSSNALEQAFFDEVNRGEFFFTFSRGSEDVNIPIAQRRIDNLESRFTGGIGSDLASNEVVVQRREEQSAASIQILDLLEQIATEERSLLGSSNTIELGRNREDSFLDISRRRGLSLDNVFNAVSPENIGFQSGLNQATLGVQRARSFQEVQADSLEELVELTQQSNVLLAAIVSGLDNNASTDPNQAFSLVKDTINNFINQGAGSVI